MADAQRTIEYLFSFKQQGQELLQALPKAVENITAAVGGTVAAVQEMQSASQSASSTLNVTVGNIAAKFVEVKQQATAAGAALKASFDLGENPFTVLHYLQQIREEFGNDAKAAEEFANDATASFARVGEAAKRARSQSSQAGGGGGGGGDDEADSSSGFHGTIQGLKGTLGRNSDFTQAFKILSGGGAIAGIGLAVGQFRALGDELARISDDLANGRITRQQAMDELAFSIPLVGSLARGIVGIQEALTGEKAALEAATAAAKAHNQEINKAVADSDAAIAKAKESYKQVRSLEEEATRLDRSAQKTRIPAGIRTDLANVSDENFDRQDQISKTRQDALSSAGATETQLTHLQQLIDNYNKSIAAYGGPDSPVGNLFVHFRDALQRQLDAATDAAKDINAAADKALSASDRLFGAQAAKIKIDDAQKQTAKYVEEAKKAWDSLKEVATQAEGKFDASIQANLLKMQQAGQALTDSNVNPQAKYDDGAKSLDRLKAFHFIDATTYDAELAKLKADLNQEVAAANGAAAQKAIAAQEAIAATTTGYDQMVAKNQTAYLRDLANWKKALDLKEISPEQFATIQKQLGDNLVNANAGALAQMKIDQDEYDVAIKTGLAQQQASAQLSYDRDVAAWKAALDQKRISNDQYDALILSRQKQLQDSLDQLQQKKTTAGLQNNLLVDQSKHNGAAAGSDQAAIFQQQQNQQLKQQYDQGLLNDQQYQDGLTAIDTQANEKRTEAAGSFADGLQLGFKKMGDSVQSQAQIGEKVANDFATDFGTAFGEIVGGTKSVGDAFRDMAVSILSEIAKMEAENAIKELFGAMSGDTSGSGGSGGDNGSKYASSGIGAIVGGLVGALFGGGSADAGGSSDDEDTFFNKGGVVPGYAGGGIVAGGPWGPDRDTVRAKLTPGEGILTRSAMAMPGIHGLVASLNCGRMPSLGSAAASIAAATTRAASARDTSSSGTSGGGPILAAIPATEQHMETLVNGGRNTLISFIRSNWNHIKPRGS